MRGSFTTNSRESGKSRSTACTSSSWKRSCSDEPYQPLGNWLQSNQLVPADSSIRSWISTIFTGSKKPLGLYGMACMSRFGSVAPSKFTIPARAEVPLRCIPGTRMACRFMAGHSHPARLLDVARLGIFQFSQRHFLLVLHSRCVARSQVLN